MVRRIISIGVTAIMLMSMLVVINVFPVENVRGESGAPVFISGNVWATPGTWTIQFGDTISHADKTIIVNGDLIIEEFGSLTLTGVTLMMNSSFNGEFKIQVEEGSGFDGGRLIIQNSGPTPSIITSYTEDGDHNFGFEVWGSNSPDPIKDGRLTMTNSELRYCGYDTVDLQSKDRGLWINSRNNVIDGNIFYNNTNGVNYYNIIGPTGGPGGPNVFQNNNISYSSGNGTYVRGAPSISILNNEYYRCRQGLDFNISSNAIVEGNTFDELYGMGAYFGRVTNVQFNDNIIKNQLGFGGFVWVGVFFGDFCSNIKADHNNLSNMPYNGMMAIQFTGYVEFTNNSFDDFYRILAFVALYGDDVYFYRNSVGQNKIWAALDDTVGIWVGPIRGYCSIVENEIYNMERWTYSNWGAGVSMWAVETVVLRDNTLSDNDGSGAYLIDCGNLSVAIDGNLLENNGLGLAFSEPSEPPSYGGVKNAVVDNNDINGNSIGVYTDGGTNQKFTNNTFDINTNAAIANYIDGTYIANNVITNTGEGDGTYEGGIALLGTAALGDPTINPIVENVVLYNNEINDSIGFMTYQVAGIFLEDVDNILIEECTLTGNEVGIQSYGDATNVLIENSTITDGIFSDNSFVLDSDSHLTTLNTPHNNVTIDVKDVDSNLTVKWYLHAQVKQGGTGQNGVLVETQDILGYDHQSFTTTNDESMQPGWVKWIQLTEFVDEGGTRVNHTKHWINASLGSAEAFARPNMWMSHSIELELNEVPIVSSFAVGASVVFRDSTIYIFMNGTDVETWESYFNAEFQYRDPNEPSWNTTYFGPISYYDPPPSDPDDNVGQWYVDFTPPINATTGLYDFRGRVQDTYGSWSLWTTLFDSVVVRNNLPDVVDMSSQSFGSAPPGALYRGENAWIYGDGYDVEDGTDQNFMAAEFEYKRPGESFGDHTVYWNPDNPQTGNDDWYNNFLPAKSIDTPVGIYDFQVRFQDTDGDWGIWENLENIDVWNNPPEYLGFMTQSSFIYRGGAVRVYADAQDEEQTTESDLSAHFYYQHTTLGTGWEDTWMSLNGNHDGFSFFADFTPPYTAELGTYKFKVEITDTEYSGPPTVIGDTVEGFPTDFVDVRNNLPTISNIKTSTDSVRANVGEKVYINVNASDGSENLEQELSIVDIQWRKTGSGSYDVTPPGAFTRILNEGFESAYGGYLRGSLEPEDADRVMYDIRIRVEDQDGGVSDWMELTNAFTVTNPSPTLIDYNIGINEVFRGDTVYIFVNASDPSPDLDEDDLDVLVEYRKKGDSSDPWTEIITNALNDYDGTNGFWTIPFTPDVDLGDSDLGDYEFHIRVYNGIAFSNNGDWTYPSEYVMVKNNVPEATGLSSEESTMERGGEILIFADGTDRETEERLLIAIIEYSTDGGESWEKEYLSTPTYNSAQSRWEADFSPDSVAFVGDYDFRIRFNDEEDYSAPKLVENLVSVTNALPIVSSLTISKSTIFRMDDDPVTLTAVVSDADLTFLTANFQYKEPGGSWVDQDDSGSYFGDPFEKNPGTWEIIFEPPAGAKIGEYSFRVEFTDEADSTSVIDSNSELLDALTLENVLPEIEIDKPSSGSQDSAEITFEATGFDKEGSILIWEWDFDDGSETSSVESPTHKYSDAGDYQVTVTLTDEDGGEAVDTVTITIGGDTVSGGGMDMMMLLLLLIPIIAVVLVVVLLATRKKKKPEEVPPPAYGAPAAPGAPPEAAPPAMAPPPAAPPAMPGAPPPAAMAAPAVAAAPAAPPVGGGQNIKCPKCGTPFTVTDTTRPLTIECPNCHAKGTLK